MESRSDDFAFVRNQYYPSIRVSPLVFALISLSLGIAASRPVVGDSVTSTAGSSSADKPTVTIAYPPRFQQVSGAKVPVVISYVAGRARVNRLDLVIDNLVRYSENINPPEAANTKTYNFDTTNFSDGPHSIGARVFDTQGLSAQAAVDVYVSNTTQDTTPPVVAVQNPKPNQTVSGKLSVDILARDNVAVKWVMLFVDGTFKLMKNNPPFNWIWDTLATEKKKDGNVGPVYPNGPHQLQAKALDSTSNEGLSQIVPVMVYNPENDSSLGFTQLAPGQPISPPSNPFSPIPGSSSSASVPALVGQNESPQGTPLPSATPRKTDAIPDVQAGAAASKPSLDSGVLLSSAGLTAIKSAIPTPKPVENLIVTMVPDRTPPTISLDGLTLSRELKHSSVATRTTLDTGVLPRTRLDTPSDAPKFFSAKPTASLSDKPRVVAAVPEGGKREIPRSPLPAVAPLKSPFPAQQQTGLTGKEPAKATPRNNTGLRMASLPGKRKVTRDSGGQALVALTEVPFWSGSTKVRNQVTVPHGDTPEMTSRRVVSDVTLARDIGRGPSPVGQTRDNGGNQVEKSHQYMQPVEAPRSSFLARLTGLLRRPFTGEPDASLRNTAAPKPVTISPERDSQNTQDMVAMSSDGEDRRRWARPSTSVNLETPEAALRPIAVPASEKAKATPPALSRVAWWATQSLDLTRVGNEIPIVGAIARAKTPVVTTPDIFLKPVEVASTSVERQEPSRNGTPVTNVSHTRKLAANLLADAAAQAASNARIPAVTSASSRLTRPDERLRGIVSSPIDRPQTSPKVTSDLTNPATTRLSESVPSQTDRTAFAFSGVGIATRPEVRRFRIQSKPAPTQHVVGASTEMLHSPAASSRRVLSADVSPMLFPRLTRPETSGAKPKSHTTVPASASTPSLTTKEPPTLLARSEVSVRSRTAQPRAKSPIFSAPEYVTFQIGQDKAAGHKTFQPVKVDVRRKYLVRAGDTVTSVAREYGVTSRMLINTNGLRDDSKLKAGQQLVIPPGPLMVFFDAQPMKFDSPPSVFSGLALGPFRPIFEHGGGKVQWLAKGKQVYAKTASQSVTLKIGSDVALVNESKVKLDLSAFLRDGRTIVPLRFFRAALGVEVDWDPETGSVEIRSK